MGTARWALVLAVAVNMAVAFFPYRLDVPHRVPNGASVDSGLVTLDGTDAVARTTRPPAWLATARETGEFWVELEVRVLDTDQHGAARIVAVEAGYARADVMIGQQRSDLTVSVRRPDSDAAGDPGVAYQDAFDDHAWHEVTVTGRPDEFRVVVDGGPPAFHRVRDPGAFRSWDTGFRLYVGDAATGNRPWHGQVRRLEAGSGDVREDYLAPGVLEVPERVWHVPERFDDPLGWRSDTDRAPVLALLHLLAFVPVGALLAAAAPRSGRRRGRVAGLVIVVLAALVQAGKALFAGRHPALVDLTMASVGGWAGWAGYARLGARRRREAGDTAGAVGNS